MFGTWRLLSREDVTYDGRRRHPSRSWAAIPWVVPRVGTKIAELMETSIMLVVTIVAARLGDTQNRTKCKIKLCELEQLETRKRASKHTSR